MRIDLWSDVACPWCLLGKRNLEIALREEGLAGEAEVVLRSFELDPARGASERALPHLARKLGGAERVAAAHARLDALGRAAGLAYDFERALVARTFDAHRVHHLAKARGAGGAVMERFMRAYHEEGADLAAHATIRALAVEAGLDGADVDAVLASDAYAEDVRADEREAAQYGIRGVPFFVFGGRFALSGAQPVEAFREALRVARRGSTLPDAR